MNHIRRYRTCWVDPSRVNPWGGAIAHGHPLGATGAGPMSKIVHQLETSDERYGVCTTCIDFGQGIATLVERLG